MDEESNVVDLDIEKLGLDYDKSRFHNTGEVILQATFLLYRGDVEKAKFTATEWAKRKKLQPRNSPGCAFANITQEQKESKSFPTTSVGYIVEHEIGLSGFRVGDAAISKDHHNFIVNEGNATASDYLAVLKEIYNKTKEKLDIELVPEIILLGFEPEEIAEFRRDEQKKLRKVRNNEIKAVYKK